MSERDAAHSRQRNRLYLLVGALCLLVVFIALSTRSAKQSTLDVGTMSAWRAEGGGGGGGGGARGGGMAQMRASGSPAASVDASTEEVGFEPARTAPSAWPTTPMLIRTASLRMRVDDVPKAHAQVAAIARAAGGYVANSTLSAEAGPTSAGITIRVPNEGLDSAVDQIAALGKLLNKQIGAQEVTEEYVDLTSRRRNLQREELRLLDLLQRAGKVRELLEVEQEVGRVRGEIETISGRLRYLENRVALSTIQVQLEGPQPKPTAGGPVWTARDVAREAARSLLGTWQSLATLGIWLGIYAPVWLPLGLVLVWALRRAGGLFPKA